MAENDARNLGVIELRRGATIHGLVVKSSPETSIELHTYGVPPHRPLMRIKAVRGYFEFAGVSPGTYRVIARTPGMSAATSENLVVTTGSSYRVADLRFRQLSALRVAVTPPADVQQRPWRVTLGYLTEGSSRAAPISDDNLSLTGWYERTGLDTGRYLLSIRDADNAIVYRSQITIDETPRLHNIRIDQVPLVGTVSAGSHGVRAKLEFTSKAPHAGRRIRIAADDEGAFSGTVPHEGIWDVRISSAEDRSYVMQHNIEIKRGEDGTATVQLVVPGGELRGLVVDNEDKPLAERASIMLVRDGRPEANALSDAEGQFEFFGLRDGNVMLRAVTASGLDTGLIPAVVGPASSPVRLVVRKEMRVRGVLLTHAGEAISGAILRYLAPTIVGQREITTDPAGIFEIRLPEATPIATVIVLARHFPVMLHTLYPSQELVQLVLSPTSGELFIPMKPGVRPPTIALPNGAPVQVAALVFPYDGSGSPQGVRPDGFLLTLASGAYTVCTDDCRSVRIQVGQRSNAPMPSKETP
jgi:hypothetical protein